jgi:hypothetical protein
MRIQSAPSTSVHPPSSSPTAKPSPAKPFSQHVGPKTKQAESGHGTSTAANGANPAPSSATPSTAAAATAPASGTDTGGIESSLDQSQDQNMQFLQLQSQMNDQSETFTTLSNVMKTENDTLKNTAGNMAI